MKQDVKIAVIGLGGVGGYIGAALADTYENVTFAARGGRKASLEEKGLILHSDCLGERTVHPKQVVESVRELPAQDYIFVCVKNYSLEEVCEDICEAAGEGTVIIPVMNGADPGAKARRHIGRGTVLDSLIYIVSYIDEAYEVIQKGDYAHIHIGLENPDRQEQDMMNEAAELMRKAGLDCRIDEDIQKAIWKKYSLNCAFNVMTAYYSTDTEGIRGIPERLADFKAILYEAREVARAKGIDLSDAFLNRQLEHFMNVQEPDASSSLCRDMDAGRRCELETFSGYLVSEAERLNIAVPVSKRYYEGLKKKQIQPEDRWLSSK
ncbi:2-dehydropantoate 2-reductase [Lachnospiraceae bacterium]|uniref:ketopantoate reductase family protein n=1 Tax=Extibacter sp. GGCC_0201 TaxID=2731209 RepID=UPI001AA184DA|nr:2-dehydropantoate 2-reductase [Extibacter sp. GGCC_0201]MBO1722175.1 2-dehydropantoate 2-reductase [Extibacter sp. GGCC_0201]BDF32123.1 2-dehydropantoate 2-reductase [Lachnospiraceae bacterium]BDF36135.1 2-dehydropantoate 2-reductase [Lachnospiraceae bacterium]